MLFCYYTDATAVTKFLEDTTTDGELEKVDVYYLHTVKILRLDILFSIKIYS